MSKPVPARAGTSGDGPAGTGQPTSYLPATLRGVTVDETGPDMGAEPPLPPTPVPPPADKDVPPVTDAEPRPTSMDPHELGFTPRRPVGWLGPLLLLSTGIRTLLAILFGAYLDKRELQNALPAQIHEQPGVNGELWLDYVADLGDGFNATYSVAYLLAQPELDLGDRRLPRAQVLLMGGDQVYPTASSEAYEDRCKGPYQAALPAPPQIGERPTLFALPGNHDWYDGLTAFLRLFARRKDNHIGGWRTLQRRSYFAVRLPANWWLLAIDEQFGAYIDDPQLHYFEQAAQHLGPQDRVILMTPAPTWVKAATQPAEHDAVDYFIRSIVDPRGAQVRLLVSGDLHHYARYANEERHMVTCGGGGAYLAATHTLPDEITVPPERSMSRRSSRSEVYRRARTYPDAATSRRHSLGIFRRLPVRNAWFATMQAALHILLMLALTGAVTRIGEVQRLVTIPLIVMVLVVMGSAVLFAQPPGANADRHARHWILGVLHGAAHVGLAAAGSWVWLQLPFRDWTWPLPLLAAVVVYGPVIGFVATQLTAAYLLVAGSFGVNVNELFAGQGIEDNKSFLRMHIADDGTLTLYPIAVDRICGRWSAAPDGPIDSSWLRPEQPLVARLAEQPVTVAGPARPNAAGHAERADAAPGQSV
jgi:Calcineurin-like phosphoesterase